MPYFFNISSFAYELKASNLYDLLVETLTLFLFLPHCRKHIFDMGATKVEETNNLFTFIFRNRRLEHFYKGGNRFIYIIFFCGFNIFFPHTFHLLRML